MRLQSLTVVVMLVGAVNCGDGDSAREAGGPMPPQVSPGPQVPHAPPPAPAPAAYQVCASLGALAKPEEPQLDAITALAVSRDGRQVAAGRWAGDDTLASLWQVENSGAPKVFGVGSLAGLSFEFSPAGDRLAAAGDQRGVYQIVTGKPVFSILPEPGVPFPGAGNTLRFSPDGGQLATGDFGHTITRLTAQGTEVSRWQTAGVGAGVAYSPDGTLLASSVPEVWRVADSHQVWKAAALVPGNDVIWTEHSAEFSPDGATLLVSTCSLAEFGRPVSDCQAATRLFRASDGTLIADLGQTLSRRPTYSPDGARLVAGSQVMDIATRAIVRLPVDAVLAAYLPDGRIAVAERDGAVRLVCPAP